MRKQEVLNVNQLSERTKNVAHLKGCILTMKEEFFHSSMYKMFKAGCKNASNHDSLTVKLVNYQLKSGSA